MPLCANILFFFIFSHVPVPLLFRNTIHFKLLRRVDRGNICPGVEKVRQWLGEVSGVRDKRIQASLQVRPLKKKFYFHFFKFLTNFNCLCKYFSLKAVLPTVLWAGASFFFLLEPKFEGDSGSTQKLQKSQQYTELSKPSN